MGKQKATPEPSSPLPRWRTAVDLVVSFGTALALAVAIKWALFDFYSIPSGSMEPTLFGKDYCGDRVFCFKQSYRFRESPQPYRWEVFVFTYPALTRHDQYYDQNFIKRCVGLPGDTVYIADGDLYVENDRQPIATISRKPLALQDSIWIPVYREDFARNSTAALHHHWAEEPRGIGSVLPLPGQQVAPRSSAAPQPAPPTETAGWTLRDKALYGETTSEIHLRYRPVVDGFVERGVPDRHVKRQVVTFRCPQAECPGRWRKTVDTQQLTAYCPVCGTFLTEANIEPESFAHPGIYQSEEVPARMYRPRLVRDLRVACRLRPLSTAGEFAITLYTDRGAWQARFPLGDTGPVALWHVTPRGEALAAKGSAGLPRRETGRDDHHIEVFRADDRLVVRLNGEAVITHFIEGARPDAHHPIARSGAILTLRHAAARLDDLALDRDLHYVYHRDLRFNDHTQWQGLLYFYNTMQSPALRRLVLDGRAGKTTPESLSLLGPAGGAEWERLTRKLARMDRDHAYIVPDGSYLAFGDNAPTSNDSRNWGPVPADNLIGPALFVWWPPHRIGILR